MLLPGELGISSVFFGEDHPKKIMAGWWFGTCFFHTQMLHVWYIYLQNWVIFRANVGSHIPDMENMGYIRKNNLN